MDWETIENTLLVTMIFADIVFFTGGILCNSGGLTLIAVIAIFITIMYGLYLSINRRIK